MEADQMVDGGTCRRLTRLVQPEAWNHRGEIRSPDAWHEGRFCCRSHGAGGGAEDIGHPACRRSRLCLVLPPDRSDTARMSIDQPGSNGCPFTQAQICGRFCRQPAAQCRSRIDNGGADAVKIIRAEFGKTDGLEIVGVPAALMTKVGPFAGNRADGPCKAAGRPPCQEIGQVEKMLGFAEDLWPVLFQPEQFRGFHFR